MEQEIKTQFADELADFVNKEYQRRQTERKPFELQWRLNMEFLNGNQYLDINAQTMSIEEIPRLDWYQEREVFNQIATIAETRISRLKRQKPKMKVRPASSDFNDISSAKISSMLLNSAWHEQEMESKYNQFIAWLEVTGNAFWKPIWNPDKGRIIRQEVGEKPAEELKTEQESVGNDYEPTTIQSIDLFKSNEKVMTLREGDIDTIEVSPFEIYPDNNHGDIDECKSIIHAKAYHIYDIEDMYGVKVDAEDVDVTTLQESSSSIGGMGYSVGTFKGGIKKLKNHAVIKEYYEKPSKRFPYGRFIVVAKDKCLYAGPLPYRIGRDNEPDLPFVKAVSIPVAGSFWGKSVIERCIPIQRRYNAVRNRKAEYLNLVAIGQWYEPEGVLDDDTVLNNAPGNKIKYRDTGRGIKPEPVQFPTLPNSFEKEVADLMAEFTAISGVSELSRFSEAPSGVKSGVALSIANEQDDTRVSMTVDEIVTTTTKLGKIWLRMYKQFAQEPRLIRNVGSDSQIELKQWTVSMLTSEDVIVENSSALSETPAQRRQMAFDLIGTGIFNRPETNPFTEEGVRKILEILEFGHWEGGIDDDRRLQVGKAKRENQMLMQGQFMNINDYDDDMLHILEHNRVRMTNEYEQLMMSPYGPIIDEIFKAHIFEHSKRIQMKQQYLQNQFDQGQVV